MHKMHREEAVKKLDKLQKQKDMYKSMEGIIPAP